MRLLLLAVLAGALVLGGALLWLERGARPGNRAGSAAEEAAPAPRALDAATARPPAAREPAEPVAEGTLVPVAPPEGASAPATPGAEVVVEVARGTGEPVEGVRLVLETPVRAPRTRVVLGPGSRGDADQGLLTDYLGRAVFDVKPGVPYTLQAWEEGSGEEQRTVDVAPLAPGAVRPVRIAWDRPPPAFLFGRIVRADVGTAVAGARVRLLRFDGPLNETRTRVDGTFELRFRPHLLPYVRIDQAGFTPRWLLPVGDLGAPGKPLRIALEAGGTLRVHVVTRALQPVPSATVRVRARLGELEQLLDRRADLEREALERAASTDAAGNATFDALPVGWPLALELATPARTSAAELLVLAPGEAAERTLLLPNPGGIGGRLVDRGGEPIVDQELWLVRADPGAHERYLACGEPTVATTVTEADGRFAFSGVEVGWYALGPCPPCPPTPALPRATRNPAEVAPVAVPVQVREGEDTRLPLTIARGLYLEGRVVGPNGRGAPALLEVRVAEDGDTPPLRSPDAPGHATDAEGGFRVGPLRAERHRIGARLSSPPFRSAVVGAAPGTVNLRLRLDPAQGTVAGRVLEVDGVEVEAGMVALYAVLADGGIPRPGSAAPGVDASPRPIAMTEVEGGAFAFEGVEPGTYAIVGTRRGRGGIQVTTPRRIALGAHDGGIVGLTLVLRASAIVRLRLGPAARAGAGHRLEVWCGGIQVVEQRLVPVQVQDVLVPSGEVTLLLRDRMRGFAFGSSLDLAPGARVDVVLGG